jgi:hypothetical protein
MLISLPSLNNLTRFATIAEGPGSMAMYLSGRFTAAHGVGITLDTTDAHWAWHPEILKRKNFKVITTGGGDIKSNTREIIADMYPGTVDFVLADGGQKVVDASKDESEIFALLAAEAHIATRILRRGGDMVLKIKNSVEGPTAALIWNIACCFEKIYITHTVAVRPNNQERYLVGVGLRQELQVPIPGVHLTKVDFPEEFWQFMYRQNMRSLQTQTEANVAIMVQNMTSLACAYDPLPDSLLMV